MKKLFFTLSFIAIAMGAMAQQDTVWRRGGLIGLNFSQVSLTNWAAGGENSIAGNSIVNYFAHYKKGKTVWDTDLNMGYGLLMQGKKAARKSDDKFDFSTKVGHEAIKNWYYTLLLNFRTQFAPGFNYPNDTVKIKISDIFSPAYATLALGMDYKPNPHFSLFISPIAARWTIVTAPSLSDAGAFGVDSGKTVKTEVGALLKATVNVDLSKTINLATTLDLFSNYLDKPQNIDVNWQLLLSAKVGKFLSVSLTTQLIYDDNTNIVFYNSDGTFKRNGKGIQFKEVLGIGLAYKFSGVTVSK